MSEYRFNIHSDLIFTNPNFSEANVHELRVLLALRELGGKASASELCELCFVSEPRLHSALMFWESAGVISLKNERDIGDYGNEITDEFSDRYIIGGTTEDKTKDVARTIRNNGLSNLFDELSLMAKQEMSPMYMKKLSEYISQYKISSEYVLTLAAYLESRGSFTTHNLMLKIDRFIKKGIITLDELNAHLLDSEEAAEYRRIFGIYNRNLTASEKKFINKWKNEYKYGIPIVSLAYDKSVGATSKLSFAYINKLLTDWHEYGCKTLEDCESRHEAQRIVKKNEYAEKNKVKRPTGGVNKKEEPRFGSFDPEEAVRRAIARTYSNSSGSKENS